MPDGCFCEAVRPYGIRQPANTASAFVFVLVAMIILARGRSRRIAALFAFTLTFVGLGSVYYHATLTFAGQFFDVLGMYLFATLAVIMSVNKMRRLTASTMIVSYIAINAVLSIVLYTAPEFRRWIFGFLLLAIAAAELRDRTRQGRYLIRAVVIMTVAFIIWIVDFAKVACAPTSIVQGHAIWHILSAVSAWFLYLHYAYVARIRK